jgi:hypothetical protein
VGGRPAADALQTICKGYGKLNTLHLLARPWKIGSGARQASDIANAY